jgi:nucleotide-binding universal stress UspA family protein
MQFHTFQKKTAMKRILVPCDFSEPAQEAYFFAMNIATQSHADVFVLRVIDLPFAYETSFGATPYSFDPMILKDIEESAKNDFERMKSKHARKEQITFTALHGPVTGIIRQFITDYKIELVVMGTHGTSGLKEYLIGSNTEKIVRFSPVPVLAIRKSFDLSQIKNIVFPTTLEFDQVHFVSHIKELQSFFSATLHLLRVNIPGTMKRTTDEMKMMEEYVKHYKLKDYTLNIRNDFDTSEGIINFAHEIKANMIAMGTHGRRGLEHLFLGSLTEDVVNHVNCPIWTFSIKR